MATTIRVTLAKKAFLANQHNQEFLKAPLVDARLKSKLLFDLIN